MSPSSLRLLVAAGLFFANGFLWRGVFSGPPARLGDASRGVCAAPPTGSPAGRELSPLPVSRRPQATAQPPAASRLQAASVPQATALPPAASQSQAASVPQATPLVPPDAAALGPCFNGRPLGGNRVLLRLQLSKDGRVRTLTPIAADFLSAREVACMTRVARAWRFDATTADLLVAVVL
jgi:hypothetical protein